MDDHHYHTNGNGTLNGSSNGNGFYSPSPVNYYVPDTQDRKGLADYEHNLDKYRGLFLYDQKNGQKVLPKFFASAD